LATGRRVILTRPASDSQSWSQGLQAAGYEVLNWPLIDIAPATNQALILQALSDWQQYQAVMFVSRNAVTHTFNAGQPVSGWGNTRSWATGPGTRQALIQAGVPAHLIDAPPMDAAQFDTEALWQVVHGGLQTDKPVLILRGSEADQTDPRRRPLSPCRTYLRRLKRRRNFYPAKAWSPRASRRSTCSPRGWG